ncbi:Os02g0233300 [Oryza sativa Japonica Group]|uniref:Os02g0233300 protein n=2 Tax=Oryza sativa subsp. japonica TaxID=39947 RepID=Q6EUF0_ORYSJ|nr:hypothetical protein [Oryza sativa Japonica Group]BAS77797.1 Os02g0233300 [Oryza sativa Japonica Group]
MLVGNGGSWKEMSSYSTSSVIVHSASARSYGCGASTRFTLQHVSSEGGGAQTMHRHGSKQSHGEDGLHSPRVCDCDEDSQRVTIQLPTMGLESRDATSGGDLRSRAKDDSYHNPQAPCKEELGAVTGQRRRWW